jgi:hypothetical protein
VDSVLALDAEVAVSQIVPKRSRQGVSLSSINQDPSKVKQLPRQPFRRPWQAGPAELRSPEGGVCWRMGSVLAPERTGPRSVLP